MTEIKNVVAELIAKVTQNFPLTDGLTLCKIEMY